MNTRAGGRGGSGGSKLKHIDKKRELKSSWQALIDKRERRLRGGGGAVK